MLQTLLSSTAMLSFLERICQENAAVGQMAADQVDVFTGSGLEALRI